MVPSFFDRHQSFKDALGIFGLVICVLIGTVFINAFIFRSFNVEGPSMQDTLFTGDRLLVNRTVVTWAQLQNKSYIPERGQVIVFKNPQYVPGLAEEYIVKRVVAFAGERVVLKDGKFTVYDNKNLNGIDPDTFNDGKPTAPIEGEVDTIVPEGTVFVVGDNRVDGYSKDSRNGLGTIPYYDIIGPVSLRIFPFDQIRIF